jgi:hypothetical protein
MNSLELRNVRGNLLDLGLAPGAESLEVGLSASIIPYKDEFQLVGDELEIEIDSYGEWNADLVDTDNMPDGSHYVFRVEGRLYRRLVPLSAPDWRFRDLPAFGC